MNNLIWSDGRTPLHGQIAGSLVIHTLAQRESERIESMQGTVFRGTKTIYLARYYTHQSVNEPQLHWCNVSREQHTKAIQLARHERRDLRYLFVTLKPDVNQIDFWLVPSSRVDELFKTSRTDSAAFHIRLEDGRQLLNGRGGSTEVTDMHHTIRLSRDDADRVHTAIVEHEQRERGQTRSPLKERGIRPLPSDSTRTPSYREAEQSNDYFITHRFPLRPNVGVILKLPVDLATGEVERLTKFLNSLVLDSSAVH